MLVSLAPVRFSWSIEQLQSFYSAVADWPVDIVYLGETFCGKRRVLSWEQWNEIGKQVVYASNPTYDTSMSIMQLQRMSQDNDFQLEVADMGYLQMLQLRRRPHVIGHSINVGTQDKLQRFAELGMTRWVMPREADSEQVISSMRFAKVYEQPRNYQVEATVYGMFPSSSSIYCGRSESFEPLRDCVTDCDIGIMTETWRKPEVVAKATYDLRDTIVRFAAWGADVFRVVPNQANMLPVLETVKGEVDKLKYVDLEQILEQEWQAIAEQRLEQQLQMVSL